MAHGTSAGSGAAKPLRLAARGSSSQVRRDADIKAVIGYDKGNAYVIFDTEGIDMAIKLVGVKTRCGRQRN